MRLVLIEFLDSQGVGGFGGGGWVTKRTVTEEPMSVLKFCGFIISEDDRAYTICQGYPVDYETRGADDFAYLNAMRIPKGAVIKVTDLVEIGTARTNQ